MDFHSTRRVSEEYVISQIHAGYVAVKYEENSSILKKYLTPEILKKQTSEEWAQMTPEELLELKMQINRDIDIFEPFKERFGVCSIISPRDYQKGLRDLGICVANIIRLKREEEIDAKAYRELYADGFKMVEDKKFLKSKERHNADLDFLVYRRITDPFIYISMIWENVFWIPMMDHVYYQILYRRNFASTKEDHDNDRGYIGDNMSAWFYIDNINKNGIRTYAMLAMQEIVYWSIYHVGTRNDASVHQKTLSKTKYITSRIYGASFSPANVYADMNIDWSECSLILTGLNWRELPGILELLDNGSLSEIKNQILLEATKAKTAPLPSMVLDYVYGPGSRHYKNHINKLEKKEIPSEHVMKEVWVRFYALINLSLVRLYNEYGASFGLAIDLSEKEVQEEDFVRTELILECSKVAQLLTTSQLEHLFEKYPADRVSP